MNLQPGDFLVVVAYDDGMMVYKADVTKLQDKPKINKIRDFLTGLSRNKKLVDRGMAPLPFAGPVETPAESSPSALAAPADPAPSTEAGS